MTVRKLNAGGGVAVADAAQGDGGYLGWRGEADGLIGGDALMLTGPFLDLVPQSFAVAAAL